MAGGDDAGKLPNPVWLSGLIDETKGDPTDVPGPAGKRSSVSELAREKSGLMMRAGDEGSTKKQT